MRELLSGVFVAKNMDMLLQCVEESGYVEDDCKMESEKARCMHCKGDHWEPVERYCTFWLNVAKCTFK